MATDSDNPDTLLLVRVGRVHLALPALATDGIAPMPTRITALPGGDASLPGVFEHGGHAVALVDLRVKLGLPAHPQGRVVLGTVGNQRLGFVVDDVPGLLQRGEASPMPLPPELTHRLFSEALLARGQITLRTQLAHLLALDSVAPLKRMAAEPAEPTAPHVPLDQTLSRAAAELAKPDTAASPPSSPGPTPGPVTAQTQPVERSISPPPAAAPARVAPRAPAPKPTPARPALFAERPAMEPARPAPAAATDGVKAVAAPAPGPETAGRAAPFEPDAVRPAPSPIADSQASERRRAWAMVVVALVGLAGLGWGLSDWHPSPPPAAKASAPVEAPPPPVASVTEAALPAPPPRVHVEPSDSGMAVVVDAPASPTQEKREIVHTVVTGDTLWAIATRYIHDPLAYRDLARHSGIHDPDLIHPGDQVRIVFRGERPSTP